ncbi:MAG: 16S rRNA (guanine(527)-N(7))-methyltransferase RsmG [Bifidobacteriaceae bacterium]|jgi:16S rRNA (guanine527-N7)-methyltransferase|nr:16S rRNA (guanine(527)-N(7))-methyltransferase RsmG [Bifidobacteriaceae bacterium]
MLGDAGAGQDWLKDVFGPSIDKVGRLAELLEEQAEVRGLLGPQELDRLWERHLVNCALLEPLLPPSGLVIDVGSGAGLPGLVLSAMRPELEFELVDSKRRRADWLDFATSQLELGNVRVTWGRAEELRGRDAAGVVSRAVGSLAELARLTSQLLAPKGVFLALKGRQAAEELERFRIELERRGLGDAELLEVGSAARGGISYVVRAWRR